MDDNLSYQQMQDEMSRFEAEIAGERGLPTVIGSSTYNNVQQRLDRSGNYSSGSKSSASNNSNNYSSSATTYAAEPSSPQRPQPAILSSAPQLYKKSDDYPMVPQVITRVMEEGLPLVSNPVVNLSKLNELPPFQPSAASTSRPSKKERKNKKMIRSAGGQVWEDTSLTEWGDDDFRLFCGDLGNDVTDELLMRTFGKYSSFLRAKVIRDKRTNKSKGFGFVSFKEPADFIKAMKEMNGRYVGSRPIKLRKSTWKNRSLDVVRKKEKEKAALISLLTSGASKH